MIILENIAIVFCILAKLISAYEDNPLLVGSRAPCQQEGEPVAVDHIDKSNCYSCVCKHGFVECEKIYECPLIDGCHMLVEKTDDGCCQRCKGCLYKGVQHMSHTEWTNPENPCRVLRCEGGIITESNLQCFTPCANPVPPEPGKCCATCPECRIYGQVASDDRSVISDDPCLECRCSHDRLTCSKKACPVLQCTESRQHHPPGECCPRCSGTRTLLTAKHTCTLQREILVEGEQYNVDKCTTCKCSNETSICQRASCPILECSADLQQHVPGSCCKKCRELEIEEVRTQCSYEGKTYEDGQSWNLTACRSCKCHGGMPSCAMTRCNVTSCALGTQLVHLPGECCGKCIEVEGTCTVFGDPHYKTFDGKMYTFHGLGKYQFVTDCPNQTFAIRVANEFVNRTNRQIKTRRVAIRYGSLRINLQQKGRVKRNQVRQQLPFNDSKVHIERTDQDNIQVVLSNGIKIFWNGKSFLEVTVPGTFKSKLCGLCGNFNNMVTDDLKNRRGKVYKDTEVANFGNSWCVGSKRTCAMLHQKSRQYAQLKACNYNYYARSERNKCKLLSSPKLFGECESKLNNDKYYRMCKKDMCKCPSGNCHCDSLLAYARECERLGVMLPNWKRESACNQEEPKRAKSYNAHRTKATQFTDADIARFLGHRIGNNSTRKPILIH